MTKFKVLIVDDDEYICEDIALSMNKERYQIDMMNNGIDAFELFKEKRHNIIISDLQMPDKNDGYILLEKVMQHSPETAVMILTNFGDIQKAVKAMQLGAVDFLTKPVDAEQIAVKIDRISDRIVLQIENSRLRQELASQHEIVGISSAIKELKEGIATIAKTESRVLITGPNGTGKELAAWSIRNQSGRVDRPFVIVNCAALPETLIEAELFGTEKGAFTGAVSKMGKFECANGGTLFLDEIGDMTLVTQAKVLRVIENGEFTRLGCQKNIKTDIRIIAATNKNLKESIKNNLFREDLFYRLNVIELHIPPLRERLEDIPVLIEFFMKKKGCACSIGQILTDESVAYLQSLAWPGNIRELHNIVERLLVFWNGEIMSPDFVKKIVAGTPECNNHFFKPDKSLKQATTAFEREYIKRMIDDCTGNITEAAARLDLQRPYLYEKMKQLEMRR